MGEEILPFLDPLMGKLLGALQSSPRNLQETCMVLYLSIFSFSKLIKLSSFLTVCLLLFSLQLVQLHLLQNKLLFRMQKGFLS